MIHSVGLLILLLLYSGKAANVTTECNTQLHDYYVALGMPMLTPVQPAVSFTTGFFMGTPFVQVTLAFQAAARVMPIGPTEFVRPPWLESVQRLDSDLIHLRARATIAPGREWLARGFLADVLKERAGPDLIVHGPVVLDFDDLARRRFARATTGASRQESE
jgi:hypothetical protein